MGCCVSTNSVENMEEKKEEGGNGNKQQYVLNNRNATSRNHSSSSSEEVSIKEGNIIQVKKKKKKKSNIEVESLKISTSKIISDPKIDTTNEKEEETKEDVIILSKKQEDINSKNSEITNEKKKKEEEEERIDEDPNIEIEPATPLASLSDDQNPFFEIKQEEEQESIENLINIEQQKETTTTTNQHHILEISKKKKKKTIKESKSESHVNFLKVSSTSCSQKPQFHKKSHSQNDLVTSQSMTELTNSLIRDQDDNKKKEKNNTSPSRSFSNKFTKSLSCSEMELDKTKPTSSFRFRRIGDTNQFPKIKMLSCMTENEKEELIKKFKKERENWKKSECINPKLWNKDI